MHGTVDAQRSVQAVVLASLWQCALQLYDILFVLPASMLRWQRPLQLCAVIV
jgi:hypothetical protein